jgi:hypothetical protein
LPQGDAWFWSPGWPTADGIFKRVHVSPIETFDSGATPKSGEKRVEPKTLADVDIPARCRSRWRRRSKGEGRRSEGAARRDREPEEAAHESDEGRAGAR